MEPNASETASARLGAAAALSPLPGPARNMPPAEIAEKALRAREAQAVWRRYTITQLVQRETGRPAAEVDVMELCGVELILKYFTRNAHRILKDQAAARPWILFNKRAYVRYVPRGLIGLITPWNYPLLIPLGDAIGALLAGNAVLLKPSEWTTDTALFLEALSKATGLFPEGLFSVVVGDGAAGAEVVRLSDMVVFTGSTRAGRAVARAAAERLIPCVLELGGKHAMVVFKDAPLARAASAAVWGRFANCGQTCVGVERVYVEQEVYEPFAEEVARQMAALRQGERGGYGVDVGRLITARQLDVVSAHLADAKERGGRDYGGARRRGGRALGQRQPAGARGLHLEPRPAARRGAERASGGGPHRHQRCHGPLRRLLPALRRLQGFGPRPPPLRRGIADVLPAAIGAGA